MRPPGQVTQVAQQHIHQERHPHLPPHCVGILAQEVRQLQRLLDLLEEDLDLPSAAIEIGQVEGLQGEAAAKVFTAGVLHDLGKLVLAVNLPGPFAEAMEAARQYRRPLWKVERDSLGASQAEIGAALLGIWGVPDEIVEAVAWHHEPSRSSEPSFRALTVVHAANVFAHERRPDDSGFAVPEVDENYLAELGLADRVPLWRAACQSV